MNVPPSGNTGGNSPAGSVIVDWVSASLSEAACGPLQTFLSDLRRQFDGTLAKFVKRPAGLHGFKHSARSDVGGVLLAWGGERQGGRLFLDVPGDACSRIVDWHSLREFIEMRGGYLTRCDLAADDFEGTHSVDEAARLYLAGSFKAQGGGRQPAASQAGNWLTPDGAGRTLYVGRGANGKMLRVYEKGKQLGDAASPWVRWELQLRNKDRALPLELLTQPARFLRGAYPCMTWVSEEGDRIRVRKAQERVTLSKLLHHAREGYGRVVDVLARSGATPSEVVGQLHRVGVPRRLTTPTAEQLRDRCNGLAQMAAEDLCAAL